MSVESDTIRGRCETMCPESEIHFRLKNNIIHPLETDNPWEVKPARRRKPIPERMVKEYTRPAADKHIHPDSLRSFSALKKTISYLLGFKPEFTNSARWPIAYYFIKDRFRAVRQDLIVQRLPASQSIELLEEMIPFYLESEYRCELQQTPNYDRKLHKTELEECFSRWKSALDSLEEKKFSRDMMLAYFLHHIDDSSFRYEILKWETALSDLTSTFNDLYFSICIGNYVRFFRLARSLQESIWRYALFPHIGMYRCHALKAFSAAFCGKSITLPTSELSEWLAFSNEDSLWDCLNDMFELV